MTPLFWIRSRNFGDALNPLLYQVITGQEPEWGDPCKGPANIAIGSLAHCAHPDTVLWGTGAMADDMELSHVSSETQALAVRGPLTAWLLRKQGVDISKTVFGDPALLLPRYYHFDIPRKGRKCLVVPHYVDCDKAMKYDWNLGWEVVSPMMNTLELVRQIASAKCVVTSALHPLIVAEAYGVPAIWVEFSDDVRGNGFKFNDYYFSTIRNPQPPISIRGEHVPIQEIYERFDRYQPSLVKPSTIAATLLRVCPFKPVL